MSSLAVPTPYTTGVHYVSDNLYALGSLACAVCGHQFPITTSPHVHSVCGNCGAQHRPGAYLDFAFPTHSENGTSRDRIDSYASQSNTQLAAARFFTGDEVAEAVAHVAKLCGDGDDTEQVNKVKVEAETVRVGHTAVDNRVLEEAFCESCATHRMCKTFARQTRSADEGQTIFFQCTVCNAEWQQSS